MNNRSDSLDGTYTMLTRTTKLAYRYELTQDEYQTNKSYYYKVRAYKTINGKRVYENYSIPQLFTLE